MKKQGSISPFITWANYYVRVVNQNRQKLICGRYCRYGLKTQTMNIKRTFNTN